MKALIVDGYVDEPALLGVPPYLSPHPRYCFGVFRYFNIEADYLTIDQLREKNDWHFLNDYDYLLLIAGISVPGRYLGGTPINLYEINKISNLAHRPVKMIAGPVTKGYSLHGGTRAISADFEKFEHVISKDPEIYIYELLSGEKVKSRYELIRKVIPFSGEIVKMHPYFPYVMCELELSRGCDKDIACTFCTEPLFYGRVSSREVRDVVEEVKCLYESGARYFRFGRASNILSYGSNSEKLVPEPSKIHELYSGVREVAPELKVLHTDNANPWYLVKHKDKSIKILQTIAEYNTPGDIVSFGVESFDKTVLKLNKNEENPDAIIEAVKIVNQIGGRRVDGIPKLLPGINLLFGLLGETPETYKINFDYLKKILDMGLMLRRINIRKVIAFPGTRYYKETGGKIKLNKRLFEKFKNDVREKIDFEMLKRVFPFGTLLKEVILEEKKGDVNFGRQIGSYPILVGFRGNYQKFQVLDVVVVDHGYRSITGVIYPKSINDITYKELMDIPGIGKARAELILLNRPFNNWDDLAKILNDGKILNTLKLVLTL